MRGPGSRPSIADLTGQIAVGYSLLASLAVGLAVWLRKGVPWSHPKPWLSLTIPTALATSLGLGLVLSLVVIGGTRICVARFGWAQRLHLELQPIARGLRLWQILLIAVLSSLGEELLFRGLLQPWLGLWLSSLLFGLLHQVPGPSRWVWATWAAVVGVCFASIFALTGSLLGPLVAHALINGVNFVFLRDHALGPKDAAFAQLVTEKAAQAAHVGNGNGRSP